MSNPPTVKPSEQDGEKKPNPSVSTAEISSDTRGNEQLRGKFPVVFSSIKPWLEVILLVFGLIAVPLAIKTWIEGEVEKSVQKTLSDETVLRKIAAEAQPMLIFNEDGGVISDSGGLAYIERVVIEEKNGVIPSKILVKPKRLLQQAPLLSIIDGILIEYTAKRKEGLDWEYSITNFYFLKADWDVVKTCRFRLEILR